MKVYLKDDFEIDFGKYLSKISVINSNVSNILDKFQKSIKDFETQNISTDEIIEDLGIVEIDSKLSKSLFELSDNLKNQMFYNSLVIFLYSFLEFSLVEYCRLIDLYISTNNEFKTYKKNGLDKIKAYLVDNFKLDFNSIRNWNDINKFQKIRNLIVHNDSNIIKDYRKDINKQPDYEMLSKMKDDLTITETGYVFIKRFEYFDKSKQNILELINDIISKTSKLIETFDSSNQVNQNVFRKFIKSIAHWLNLHRMKVI